MENKKQAIPELGFLRLSQILGDRERAGIIPVSRAGWYKGVKSGLFPSPIRLMGKAVGWRVEDIRRLVEQLGRGKDV